MRPTRSPTTSRRRYFTDRQLDSVMNYPWQKAILRYVRGEDDGTALGDAIRTLAENYPPDVLQTVMNILSTHDTPRAINAILDPRDGDRTDLAQRHFHAGAAARGQAAPQAGGVPAVHAARACPASTTATRPG